MRVGVVLSSAVVFLGADCPHCDTVQEIAAASTQYAAPPCHGPAAEPTPVDFDPAPAPNPSPTPTMDCACPGCDLETGVKSMAADVDGGPTGRFVARSMLPAPRVTTRSSGDWSPPPYPGFVENTVILLN